ncbi:PREDICTED: uncharacterized protein LOC103338605 [Prunus mume]|uniref:Uncharacterized protein LOC103338605 n=1 Tax=Prunus mume TaxID=102107 RepID=A0ABM1LUM1_PRUMU|nr:PREDICTED: uncharacterized protein LOC103338605 [Prunus mume]
MQASGFGIVKTETSGIPEFGLEEILEFAVPEPGRSYLNRLTSPNSIYSRKSKYQTTRDLRLCSEKLYQLYGIHISATGDDKTWNRAYKRLVKGLPDIMQVADVVVEHKNDIFNLQTFLSLPLNPAASQKILPIFVQIVNWGIKQVIIERRAGDETSLYKEAKRTFGRKIKVVLKDSEKMEKYLA